MHGIAITAIFAMVIVGSLEEDSPSRLKERQIEKSISLR